MKKPLTSKTIPKRVRDTLETLSLESLEDLLSDERGISALTGAGALTVAASDGGIVWLSPEDCTKVSSQQRTAFLRRLIAARIDPNQTSLKHEPPLMAVLVSDADDRPALVQELLAGGADPNLVTAVVTPSMGDRTTLGRAVRALDQMSIDLLLPRANAASKRDALLTAIEVSHAFPNMKTQPDVWLTRADVDGLGPSGFAPIHAAALAGGAVLTSVLGSCANPGIGCTFSGDLPVWAAAPPQGGVVPTIAVRPGMNAQDLVTLSLALLERVQREYASRDTAKGTRERNAERASLLESRDALAAAGISPALPAAATNGKTVHHRAMDEELLRLAQPLGLKSERLAKALASIDPANKGPWAYLLAALEGVKPLLETPRAREAFAATRFLWVLLSDGDVSGFRSGVTVKPALYPKEARPALKGGAVLGGIDGTVWILWPHTPGVPVPVRVCMAHPESFEVLGNSVEEFVRNEIDAVVSAASGEARPAPSR